MNYYIPLACCECTPSTNPCDLPCFVSAVATISGDLRVYGSGSGNRISENFGPSFNVLSVPYTYTIDFSVDTEINLDGDGNGQATVYSLYDQQFEFSAGVLCGGVGCEAITVVDGIVTTGLACPADVCSDGQTYRIGTVLTPRITDGQETSCGYAISEEDPFRQRILVYFCNEDARELSPIANVALSYVACSANGFAMSFPIDDSPLNFSTTQEAGYTPVGQMFVDGLSAVTLFAGYGGFGFCAGCSGGDTTSSITGFLNVVIDRVIGYVNPVSEEYECVPPPQI